MDLLHIILLAAIQGLTEFLPISSSAHLILPSAILGWKDQGLAFDVAIHLGSLAAVVIYFYDDIKQLTICWSRSLFNGQSSPESRLGWHIILSTMPAALAGLIFSDFIELHLRTILVVAVTTIIFGLALGLADYRSSKSKGIYAFTWKSALFVGCAQALAFIPGTSRSGITITAALFLGFKRTAAVKFSFFLAIPIILLSGLYKASQLAEQSEILWRELAIGSLLSFVAAYVCIHFFIGLIDRIGMMPFVIYRLILGAFLLIIAINT